VRDRESILHTFRLAIRLVPDDIVPQIPSVLLTLKSEKPSNSDKVFLFQSWWRRRPIRHSSALVFLILGALGDEDAKQAPFRLDNAAVSVIELDERFEILTMLNFVP